MKGLQILASLLLLAAFCKAEENSEETKMKEMSMQCAEKHKISKEDVEKIPNMICSGEEMAREYKCHTACFYNKLGVMENGEIFPDEVKKMLLTHMMDEDKKQQVDNKLETCKTEIAAINDECDKAVEFTKCLVGGTEFCGKKS